MMLRKGPSREVVPVTGILHEWLERVVTALLAKRLCHTEFSFLRRKPVFTTDCQIQMSSIEHLQI